MGQKYRIYSLLTSLSVLYLAIPSTCLIRYNETEARKLLDLSAGAYSNMPETCLNRTMAPEEHWILYNKLTAVCDRINSICSGYIIRSDLLKQIIVVFRGTKTKQQLFTEGWQGLQPGVDFYGFGKVNRYFHSALEALWPFIEPLMKDPMFKNYTITFTGHSLGGALASLSAVKVIADGFRSSDQVKLITFGQPRVGDRDFAFKFGELVPYSFRVVHRLDIVPHLPACKKDETDIETVWSDSKKCDSKVSGRAYHHGTEIWYPYGMEPGAEYFECFGEPKNEDFMCSDSLDFELPKYSIYISDHRHYFDHKVPFYGKLGCVELNETVETSTVTLFEYAQTTTKAPSLLKRIATKLGTISQILKSKG